MIVTGRFALSNRGVDGVITVHGELVASGRNSDLRADNRYLEIGHLLPRLMGTIGLVNRIGQQGKRLTRCLLQWENLTNVTRQCRFLVK
jgi:hypothetical protein